MGNTPSNQHGSPRPNTSRDTNNTNTNPSSASASSSRHPNLRLPMPSRNAPGGSGHNGNSVSPSRGDNLPSPSGAPSTGGSGAAGNRSGSPRRRKSLELPDLNKLSFTPAAPVPTTATHTSHHLADSTTAQRTSGSANAQASPSIAVPVPTPSQPQVTSPSSPTPAPRRWQQVLGGRNPLSPGLGAMSKLDSNISSSAPAQSHLPRDRTTSQPASSSNAAPSYFPPVGSQTPPTRSPTKATSTRDTPPRQTQPVPMAIPGTEPEKGTLESNGDDGSVQVPIVWSGGGKNVMIAGNFANNWKGRIPMTKRVNDFHTILRLQPGQYRLKFIVDDSWRCSKVIPTATDDDGTLVNWIEVEVPKTAEEVKSEWAMDSVPPAKEDKDDASQWTSVIPEATYLYQYIEEFPHSFDHPDHYREFAARIPHMSPVPQPPVLPRLLEKVIVNNDQKSKWDENHLPGWDHAPPAGLDDNSILAVPNHVVLNHLTASAIKNGTLGVGTTTRYRKKYITTMFFKPTLADLKDDQQQHVGGPPPSADRQA